MWREVNQEQRPACFPSQADWDEYRKFARMEPPLQASYCQDCTARYQQEMLRQGRCAHPEVWFDEHGEGVRGGTPARRKKAGNE